MDVNEAAGKAGLMKQRPIKTPRAYKTNLEHIHEKDQKSLQYYILNESIIEVMTLARGEGAISARREDRRQYFWSNFQML